MKIKKIDIDSFRGISNNISIDFTKKDKPISTIIFGDNGSGKSSIIDAIEFNLQGKIERSDSLDSEFTPSVLNLNDVNKICKTLIKFEDNTLFPRIIESSYDEEKNRFVYRKSISYLNYYYKIAPIALRRNDIINYSKTPSKQKQILFWSFLYNSRNINIDDIDESDKYLINELENNKLIIKNKRNEIRASLGKELNINENDIPINGNELDIFIKNKIRNGLTSKQIINLRKKGILKEINIKAKIISDQLLLINDELKLVSDKLAKIKRVSSISSSERRNEVVKFINESSRHLTKSFLQISTTDFVKEIKVKIGDLTDVSFDIEVILKNDISTFPNKIFSEANLDLLILLLYTSIIKESEKYGQSKVLVLDDVLQSVDSIIRINFIEYLLTNFFDWQIIITTHDRLWLNQLRSSFRRNNHIFKEIEIYKWDFAGGLYIFDQIENNLNSSLIKSIESKDINLIASQTGLFLEYLCNQLSMHLNLSIQRKKEDKYNIGDLWPGMLKYFKNTLLIEIVKEIDKLLHIRNLLGAHYNEWAISLSNRDIYLFADLVNKLFLNTFCSICNNYISKNNYCDCKNININQ